MDRQYINAQGRLYKRYEVLVAIYRFVGENKTIPSERTLAKHCEMPRGTLRVHLQRLREEGLVAWCEGRLSLPKTIWEPPAEFAEFTA